MSLGRRQLAQIKTQLERDHARKDKARVLDLKRAVRAARKQRREKLQQVKCDCRKARERNRERAKRARKRLQASIVRTRERARSLCQLAQGEAAHSTLTDISRHVDALHSERATQAQLAAWTKPKRKESSRKERLQESDSAVEANIDEPGLRVVWQHVKHKIKAGPRRSRTEAFYEWVGEHSADVYAIQERDAERQLDELERLEKRARRLKGPALRRALEAVPF